MVLFRWENFLLHALSPLLMDFKFVHNIFSEISIEDTMVPEILHCFNKTLKFHQLFFKPEKC